MLCLLFLAVFHTRHLSSSPCCLRLTATEIKMYENLTVYMQPMAIVLNYSIKNIWMTQPQGSKLDCIVKFVKSNKLHTLPDTVLTTTKKETNRRRHVTKQVITKEKLLRALKWRRVILSIQFVSKELLLIKCWPWTGPSPPLKKAVR